MGVSQAQQWVESFSLRELEVLKMISNGLSNREIAQALFLSIETIKWYNKQLYTKLGVKNRVQAVNLAAELGLLESDQVSKSQRKTPLVRNLPVQLTSYIGRQKEIGEIIELLKNNRLVVLTGPGGSGKTRLALKVGEALMDAYKDGVWLVELANVHDPSLVLPTIANVLNFTERAEAPLEVMLKRFLSRRHLLLLIDNLEHLLESAASIGALLATAPRLSVLGTSRERLHIYGEQEYPVHPLNLPDLSSKKNIEESRNTESITLFIERARSVDPTLALDHDSLEDLARICVQLDGLPLAIELCAPMVKMFSLRGIADRIEKSLDAIPRGPRDLPDRQQTLRDAFQWSFDLLRGIEKRLFIRMAIFNGGGTLQSIKEICGNGISDTIENILFTLVNRNLVLTRERQDGEIHFSLLETIRQYGREKLLASGETVELAARHADYFLNLAKGGAAALRGSDQLVWTDRFIAMHDNMRAALDWVIEESQTETALDFINALFEFWLRHSDYEEARQWHSRVLAMPDAQQFPERYLEAFNHLTWVYWLQTKMKEARTCAERALFLSRSQTSKVNIVVAHLNLGLTLMSFKEYEKAQGYLETAEAISQENQFEWELARAHLLLGADYTHQAKYTSARSQYVEAFALWKKLGDIGFQCVLQRFAGDLEFKGGNLNEAIKEYCESLRFAQKVENRWIAAGVTWGLARVAKAKGHHNRALRLYLASKKIYEDIGAWWSSDDLEIEEELAAARAELGEAEFRSVIKDGQHLTMEEAIEFALGGEINLERP